MKFKGLKKRDSGRFIHRYDLYYETEDHQEKTYEIISRNKDMQSYEELTDPKADSVVIIMFNEDHSKILLAKEYRMSVGCNVYNFPAGLIDEGEDMFQAARRELWEETGLEIVTIEDTIGIGYNAIGFSNEKSVCVVGIAKGEFQKSTSTMEEIEPAWYTKAQIRDLLQKYPFAARTQAICYMWARED